MSLGQKGLAGGAFFGDGFGLIGSLHGPQAVVNVATRRRERMKMVEEKLAMTVESFSS